MGLNMFSISALGKRNLPDTVWSIYSGKSAYLI